MIDDESVASIGELKEAIWLAITAKEQEREGWQQTWIQALNTLQIYLAPWGKRAEPLKDKLDDASMLVSMTIVMLRDEQIGAHAHFWVPSQNRPPRGKLGHDITRSLVVLVAACRERERRAGGMRNPYEVAQAELRFRGKSSNQKSLRSRVSNSSRMPEDQRGMTAFALAALETSEFDPNHLIDLCADFLARQKVAL